MNEIPELPPAPQSTPRPALQPEPVSVKKKITIIEWAAMAFVLMIICIVSFNWIMGILIHHRAEVQVPDLNGRSVTYALNRLSVLQLSLIKEGEEFNQSLPEGSILRQAPIPGTMVREGKALRVVVSKGGELVFVPELVGRPLRLAEIDLRQANLLLGEVSEQYSLQFRKGDVLKQDPGSGVVVDRQTLIHLVVSSGNPPESMVLMPDFTGRPVDEAKQWAEEVDVRIEDIAADLFSAVPAGEIIIQQPEPDTELDGSRGVRFVVGVSTQMAAADRTLQYALPQGSGKRKVIIRLIDNSGDHLIYKGEKLPGTKLSVPYRHRKDARIRIFLDSILVEDRKAE